MKYLEFGTVLVKGGTVNTFMVLKALNLLNRNFRMGSEVDVLNKAACNNVKIKKGPGGKSSGAFFLLPHLLTTT
jgi:hypothetical protein